MNPEDSLPKKPNEKLGRSDYLRLAFIGLAYFAANKIALLFPDAERVLAAVWPAAGVGLAALLLTPRRSWTRVLAVIFIAGNISNLVSGRPLLNSLCFMTANCLESYGSAWLITRWCGENVKFNRIREISALVCAATLVNAATTTVVSVFASVVGLGAFKPFWLTWWVSDGLGLLIVAPVIVSLSFAAKIPKHFRFGQFIETVCFYGAMVFVSLSVFHHDIGRFTISAFPFLLFAVISWGSLRFNVATIASSSLILAIIAVTGDAVSVGPLIWGGDTPQERLQFVQLFIGILASIGLFLSTSLTETRESVKRIKETAKRLELATASASLGVWDWNVKDNIMDWDDQMLSLYGHTRQTFPGGIEAWQTGLHPDDREATWEACQSALRGNCDWDHEFRIVRPDGIVRWIKANGEVIRDQNGSPVRMLGINRDITERKEAEQLLKEKEFFFRESQRAAMVGSYKCYFIEGTWESSEVLDIIFGIDQNYTKSIQGWLDLVYPDDRDMLDRYLMEEVISSRQSFNMDYRVIRKSDDEVRWVTGLGTLEFDTEGHVLNMTGTIQDITERKQLELFRDANRKALEILLESNDSKEALDKVIALIKADLAFDAVGIRLQDGDDFPYLLAHGFPRELLVTENSLSVRNAEGGVCRDEHGNVCLECTCGLVITGKAEPDHPLFTPNGSFWTNDSFPLLHLQSDQDPRLNPRNECIHHEYASVALVPIRTKGTIIGLIQLNDRRKNRFTLNAIIELESMAGHIGERIMRDIVTDENSALQAQLVQSQKMEAVGQLAGGVAHDFNNILTVIGGYCSLLRMDGDLSDEQKIGVEAIESSAEKAAQLTHGLLAFSRKQPLLMKHENLNDIVQHVHKFLARIIGEDITLQSSCSGAELPIVADRGQIEQVLINLATNARDAMSGGGVFTVKSERVVLDSSFTNFHNYNVPPGNYAMLTVSDTGTGISKEHIDHIFEPFFTTKEVGKGTGLGMAIIYGIIKQHNGFINVYSEPGHGTTFRVYLPIDVKPNGFHTIKAESEPPLGGNETILVAEDEPSVRLLVAKVLKSHGYNVLLAEDGAEVVEKFKAHQADISLILMDMIMPKKNGKEAYEEISSIEPDVKLLFTSGYTADFIESRGVSDETIELIMKPVQPMELLRKVREILDRRSIYTGNPFTHFD